ncbi:hypothetical protein [Argonema galeatum]|uniref:hypothetical protein n=1 Tax=Argonema galeatum TaxID=2942762 RepID=UPI002012E6C8|nr:hypothetical protein [Argonema galeatum]MCL1463879.1 hypothetical protein [Argonema galeatum A003/A1]
MAKLPDELNETIWSLKRQLLDIADRAKAAEFIVLERFGETDRTISYLDELQSVAEQGIERFSQFSSIQIRIANAQLNVFPDILELVNRVVVNTQERIPALERSIQEIKTEWRLP